MTLVEGGALQAPVAAALRGATGFEEVMAINVEVADTVSAPAEAVRVELSAVRWSLLPSEPSRRLASGTGVGADYVPQRNLDMMWVALAALLGVVLSPLRHIARPPSMEAESWTDYSVQIVGGLILGGLLGLFADRLTSPLAPAMEALALNPFGWPRLATALWPLAHGGLLMLGPLILSLFVVFGIMPRVNAAIAERLDLGLLTLSIQSGALAFALAPIPIGAGWDGVLACIAMSVPSLAISAIIGERIEQIRSLIEVEPARQVAPFTLAMVGLLAAFPVMLTGRWILEMFLVGVGVSFLVGVLGRPRSRRRARHSMTRTATAGIKDLHGGGGSLRRPTYVSLDGRDVSPMLKSLQPPGVNVFAIAGPPGIGKSRLSEEVTRALSETWKIGHTEADDPQLSEGIIEPHSALGAALGAIFDPERVEPATIYARQLLSRIHT